MALSGPNFTSAFGRHWHGIGVSVDAIVGAVSRPLEPTMERWRASTGLRRRAPLVVVAVVVAVYTLLFAVLQWKRHEYFGTFDYDLGMYDNGIWQTAHGRNFMTTRGMNLFGHHANVGFLLFVPFYWIGVGGPHFLNVMNLLGIVATSVPIFLLARTHLRSNWAGAWLVVVYLAHFSPQWMIQETFHAESLALPFVVGAFYAASVRRWRWYWVCIFGAVIWKEDIALATAMIGLAVGLMLRERRVALATIGVSMLWFVLATRLIMPAFDQHSVFDGLFGPLGNNSTEVVVGAVTDPGPFADTVLCHGFWDGSLHEADPGRTDIVCPSGQILEEVYPPPRGFATLMQPFGYVGLLSPILLLVGLPQHLVNSATMQPFTWDLRWHYALMPFAGVLLATVWSVVKRKRSIVAWALISMLVVGVVTTHDRGIGPWGADFSRGYWRVVDDPTNQVYREVMAEIDGDDVVSTNYFFVPHLSHREYIYTFPNPWRLSNYGAAGSTVEPPDPATVDVVLIDRARLNAADQMLFDEVRNSGDFEVVTHRVATPPDRVADLYLLRRRAP